MKLDNLEINNIFFQPAGYSGFYSNTREIYIYATINVIARFYDTRLIKDNKAVVYGLVIH